MSKFESSKSNGAHKQLSRLEGNWKGVSKVWFGGDEPEDTSEITGTMKLLMDGRYLLHEYKGSFQGKPLEGLSIYGYNLMLERYESTWIDSFHTGTAVMFSAGERNTGENKVTGSYAYITPETEQYWNWRTELNIRSDDEIVITAYNISPGGEESKATEIVYRRA